MSRLIDADALEFTHLLVRSLDDGHNWHELCVTKEDIDNAPTIERPQGEFTIDELKKWLYQIAFNNTDNDFGEYCEEIIGRLDGFERFVTDMRKETENEHL